MIEERDITELNSFDFARNLPYKYCSFILILDFEYRGLMSQSDGKGIKAKQYKRSYFYHSEVRIENYEKL